MSLPFRSQLFTICTFHLMSRFSTLLPLMSQHFVMFISVRFMVCCMTNFKPWQTSNHGKILLWPYLYFLWHEFEYIIDLIFEPSWQHFIGFIQYKQSYCFRIWNNNKLQNISNGHLQVAVKWFEKWYRKTFKVYSTCLWACVELLKTVESVRLKLLGPTGHHSTFHCLDQ